MRKRFFQIIESIKWTQKHALQKRLRAEAAEPKGLLS